MNTSIEVIGLNLVAVGLTLAILLVVADTPAYPMAIGIEMVVILHYLLNVGTSSGIAQSFSSFISNPSGVMKK
jgi:hypothetical protein